MALSEKDVRGIAEYAKIALTDDELTQMTSYLNDAVQMLEPVLQYDLPDVEPTFHPIGSLSNVMGDDLREPERDLPLDVALENAGSARDRYFRVPSILGEGESERRASIPLPPLRSPRALPPATLPLPRWPRPLLPPSRRARAGFRHSCRWRPSLRSRPLRAWMPTVPQASRCPRSRACRWPLRTT